MSSLISVNTRIFNLLRAHFFYRFRKVKTKNDCECVIKNLIISVLYFKVNKYKRYLTPNSYHGVFYKRHYRLKSKNHFQSVTISF